MKLVYSNGSGSISNSTGTWSITEKPTLGMDFDGLFYSSESNTAYKYIGDGRGHMTAGDIEKVVAFIHSRELPAPIPPTASEILAEAEANFLLAVQAHLDAGAKALNYDSIISACSYAGATNPFQAEGQAFVNWRGSVWSYCYAELAKVVAGTRAIPTISQLLSELPARV